MTQFAQTVREVLALHDPSSIAILGEDNVTLSRSDLGRMVDSIAATLVAQGIVRTDRVAIVVRNGPQAALAFLGATSVAIAAPLNPAYTETEFRFSLTDLPASVVLTDGSSTAASDAARDLGIPELRLDSVPESAEPGHGPIPAANPGDVALVLHTSGTTGKPKRVPLTHRNLIASAMNIAKSLGLTPADRCLDVMPLFHIHGLIGCVLASLTSGGSVVCTPGFDSFAFFGWLETFQPTWYSGVPTIHQAVLQRARSRERAHIQHTLRFVRSSSSALPVLVHHNIEALFGVPFVEAYGMTEASHQIATNLLPPGSRFPGSVGRPTGVEIRIFGENGTEVSQGARGEVGIHGPSVTSGYEGVDRQQFTHAGGWLRTGDEGFIDDGGYLCLTGRLKELINRGGEKISPREVEEAFLAHPAVIEAVAFGLPHDMLGEEVAVALVVSPGSLVPTPGELRTFVSERLASFKVPRKIVTVDKIPLGPTGKPQRVGLGKRLGLA